MKRILLFSLLLFFISSHAQTGIWGITASGGRYNGGVIFKTDGSGDQFAMQKDLFRFDGEYPKANLMQASNGKLYGLTSDCCVFGSYGVFFQYDPVTKTFDKVFDFNDTINGSSPDGGVIEAKDGKLYGMTSKGGIYNWGVIFQYDPSAKIFKKLYDFDDTNGSGPLGNLLQASDGKLYGVTNTGGANDYGVLFQFDLSTNTYVRKFDFDWSTTGSNPLGNLTEAKNGKLYGLTSSGGKDNGGVLFEYDPSNSTCTKKVELNGDSDGGIPYGSLTEAPDGNLYGLTSSGGANNRGVLFQYSISSNTYTVKLDFDGGARGSNPQSSLTLGANGKLYGTTEYGGASDEGVIFEYDPVTSAYIKKFEFNDDASISGKYPIAELTKGSDGSFYGSTYIGGIAGTGVVFKFDPSNSDYKKEFDFHTSASGAIPVASMIQATDKFLYGITLSGGIHTNGTIYQYDPLTNTYTKKFDFEKNTSGASPTGSLIQATDGKLYGTCLEGGTYNKGVLFQFDPLTNAYAVKVAFDGVNGNSPYGELMQASDGKIYGMTHEGGTTDNGVLFQYDPVTSTYSKKYDFDDNGNGKYPEGGLIQADDGKLYGLASRGGSGTSPDFVDGMGVLFQYDIPTGMYTKKADFDAVTGSIPCGSLTKTKDGKLFGLSSYGGIIDSEHPLGCGVLFQYNPGISTLTGKFNFNGLEKGCTPNGSLLCASDGKLYGVTRTGGVHDKGVLFQFDPLTSAFHKKTDFKHATGKYPEHGKLIEVALINSISTNQGLQLHMELYPNPAKSTVHIMLNQPVSNATLKLITLAGQCVFEKTALNGNQFLIDISELAQGAYFAEVRVNGAISRLKLIKD